MKHLSLFVSFVVFFSLCSFVFAEPKVFGVGLSKTGTTSLGEAFRLLGLKNLHNDRTLLPYLYEQSPAEIRDPLTFFNNGRYDQWDSVEDIPSAFYFKELLQVYPDAKFVLTVRDVDGWYESFKAHTQRMLQRWGGYVPFRIRQLHEKVYGSCDPDETLWKLNFEKHIQKVKETIPSSQLLVLNIVDDEEGYDKLCGFLGRTNDVSGPCSTLNTNTKFPLLNVAPVNEADQLSWNEEKCVEKSADSPKKFAYVMLLGDVSQSRDYFTASLVLAQNIKNTGTKADIVAMNFGSLNPHDQALLESFGVIIKRVRGVGGTTSSDPGPFDARAAAIYRAKIRALQLTEYNRIIFLDLDATLFQNVDHLFDFDHFTALAGGNSPFNAGFFVMTPSCQDFVDINDISISDSFTVERGWNDYGPFPHWKEEGKMSDWSFYASHAEQGLLYYYYNCYKKTGEMKPVGSWDSLSAHMVGSHKPWFYGHEGPSQSQLDKLAKRFVDPTQLWFDNYRQVLAEIEEKNPEKMELVKLPESKIREFLGPDTESDPYCDKCQVSQWGPWSACSAQCGPGTQMRTRTITKEPSCNNTCPALNQTKTCTGKSCPTLKCQQGTCFCQIGGTNGSHANTTQSQPPSVVEPDCSEFSQTNITIDPSWGWDLACNQSQLCYTTCNSNKNNCDKDFISDLQAACKANAGNDTQECMASVKAASDVIHDNATVHEYMDDQQTHCSCNGTSSHLDEWMSVAHDTVEKLIFEYCESKITPNFSKSDCRIYAQKLLFSGFSKTGPFSSLQGSSTNDKSIKIVV